MLLIELFEAIIDQAGDDTSSLRMLSLTCRAFLPRSRFHLFRGITIRTAKQMQSCREFLDSCPWVPLVVQKIKLLEAKSGDDENTPHIHLLDGVPVDLLARLPNLRTLEMKQIRFGMDVAKGCLSLHRSTLQYYRTYGGCIRELELTFIRFNNLSDFIGLVSELTAIQSLTCTRISFRTMNGPNPTLYGSGTTMLFRWLRIRELHVTDSVDIRALEYLLSASAVTLRCLRLSVKSDRHHRTIASQDFSDRRGGELLGRLSQLSSLAVCIPFKAVLFQHLDEGLAQDIRCATRSIKRVSKTVDVRLVFELDSIAVLGSRLSSGGAAMLEACKELEGTLSTFPLHSIIFRMLPFSKGRIGRAEFWSPTIKHAFPIMHQRGLITFIRDKQNTPDVLGHEAAVTCLVASHDSKRIMTASEDGTIIIWDTSRGTVLQEWLAHQGPVVALALSPDSQRLVSTSDDKNEAVAVWDVSNDIIRRAASLEGMLAAAGCAWSPDGALIASASEGGAVRVCDGRTFRECGRIDDPAVHYSNLLQFSPDGRYLAWVSRKDDDRYTCVIWRPHTAEPPTRLLSLSSPDIANIYALTFFPESGRIATVQRESVEDCQSDVVRIWDVAAGTTLAMLAGHWSMVIDVSFSPGGRSMLSVSMEGHVKVWDTESYQEVASFMHEVGLEHRKWMCKACFSPDMRYIATAYGRTVQLWRTSYVSPVTVFSEHTANVYHLAFSPNGDFLASGDDDGVVHIRSLSHFNHCV